MYHINKHTGHLRLALISALMVMVTLAISVSHASASHLQQAEFYTVREGDSWTDIAAYFGVQTNELWKANGVVNPAQLKVGQRLYVPEHGGVVNETTIRFEVKDSSTALRAAVESGNPIVSVLFINDLSSIAVAFGQRISAPNRQDEMGVAVASRPTPTPQPEPEEEDNDNDQDEGDNEPIGEGALRESLMGTQGHFIIGEDDRRNLLLDMVAYKLDMGWVKQQVAWKDFEYAKGQFSEEWLSALDKFVDDSQNRELRIMLSIVKAPDWARNTTEEDGPPINYQDYNDFVSFILHRYKGKIHAFEIWNEPNLGREWRGARIHGADYVELLAGAYNVVKTEYPEGDITVISAGLAPTGINDGVNAVDDRTYLRQMYEAGLPQYTDAIGIHPYSWGNPPWTRCCGDWGGAPSHNDHPTFFFLDTIEDYREIQAEYDDLDRQFWATEFGWATMDGLDRPVPEWAPYFNYVNQDDQAQYIIEAFRMGQEWDFMGPMILWNLNIAIFQGSDDSQSAYSILELDDRPRPAYRTIRDTPRINDIDD